MDININIKVNGEDAEVELEDKAEVSTTKTKGGSKTLLELPDKVEQPDEKSILDLFMY
jgi:hypothetical protein